MAAERKTKTCTKVLSLAVLAIVVSGCVVSSKNAPEKTSSHSRPNKSFSASSSTEEQQVLATGGSVGTYLIESHLVALPKSSTELRKEFLPLPGGIDGSPSAVEELKQAIAKQEVKEQEIARQTDTEKEKVKNNSATTVAESAETAKKFPSDLEKAKNIETPTATQQAEAKDKFIPKNAPLFLVKAGEKQPDSRAKLAAPEKQDAKSEKVPMPIAILLIVVGTFVVLGMSWFMSELFSKRWKL